MILQSMNRDENIVDKREFAHYDQFILLSKCVGCRGLKRVCMSKFNLRFGGNKLLNMFENE